MRPRSVPALACALAALCLLSSAAFARDVAVVTNKANATRNLPLADLIKMVKGTTKKWADNKDVVLVIKDPAAPDMKTVVQKLFGMSPDEVKALVATLNAARKNSVLVLPSDEVIVKTVATMPGAVGFVDVYSINGTINVLKVDSKSPLEPGYPLHGQ